MKQNIPNYLYFYFVGFLFASFGMVVFAARSTGASLGIVLEMLAFAATVILGFFGILALLNRICKKQIMKFESLADVSHKKGGGWIAAILALFVAVTTSNYAFLLLEYLVICHVYGRDAWVHGLRVAFKNGVLTNGDVLSGWPSRLNSGHSL